MVELQIFGALLMLMVLLLLAIATWKTERPASVSVPDVGEKQKLPVIDVRVYGYFYSQVFGNWYKVFEVKLRGGAKRWFMLGDNGEVMLESDFAPKDTQPYPPTPSLGKLNWQNRIQN